MARLKVKLNHDSCQTRWSGFRFTNTKRHKGSRREKLLLEPGEALAREKLQTELQNATRQLVGAAS